ncbi:MAG: sensor histidine kinase [Actinobacteria bacterium]|nr:sensor histidine kinase [Actinomycetota bacterium]
MSDRALRWISRVLLGTSLGLVVASLGLDLATGATLASLVRDFSLFGYVMTTTFPAVGALIVHRQARHPVGWIYLLIGAGMWAGFANGYARWAFTEAAVTPPLAVLASWVGGWVWVPSLGLFVTFALMLFPDGALPSRRWRPIATVAAIGIALVSLDFAIGTWSLRGPAIVAAGDEELASGLPVLLGETGFAFLVLGATASVGSLFVRLRRARGERRQQLKWVVFAGSLAVVTIIANIMLTSGDQDSGTLALVLAAPLIPAATGIAIVRYRLYDIDLVLNRTLLFGLLGGFITAVYVGIVVGAGALLGARTDEPNVGLSLLATVVVAVAFQPARQRAQRLANRLVYGHRATPYEVMADFTAGMAGTVSTDEILPRMAEAAGRGVGAELVAITVGLPTGAERRVLWPSEAPDDGAWDHVVPVVHQGDRIGRIQVRFGHDNDPTADDVALLDDLAAQAGVALRTVGLDAELRSRADEIADQAGQIRASRVRIVAAQDEERRRMERDIHDGAQQQLVAMSVKIGLAAQLLGRDADRAVSLLDQLGEDANDALEGLRDLARGIFPPLLLDQGVVSALDAHVRKHALPVTIVADPVVAGGRYGPEVEIAVYFCCLEAVQNASKHAPGEPVTVRMSVEGGTLRFSVSDPGPGFDPALTPRGAGLQNMADRAAALGGELSIDSAPGAGTTVNGSIPLTPTPTPVPAPAPPTL